MAEPKKGSTFIKHYYSHTFEDCPHYTAEITVDEDATISEMCRAFELFLKVSGYEFNGNNTVKINTFLFQDCKQSCADGKYGQNCK